MMLAGVPVRTNITRTQIILRYFQRFSIIHSRLRRRLQSNVLSATDDVSLYEMYLMQHETLPMKHDRDPLRLPIDHRVGDL